MQYIFGKQCSNLATSPMSTACKVQWGHVIWNLRSPSSHLDMQHFNVEGHAGFSRSYAFPILVFINAIYTEPVHERSEFGNFVITLIHSSSTECEHKLTLTFWEVLGLSHKVFLITFQVKLGESRNFLEYIQSTHCGSLHIQKFPLQYIYSNLIMYLSIMDFL